MALRPKSKLKHGSKKKLTAFNVDFNELFKKAAIITQQRKKPLSLLGGIVLLLFLFSSLFKLGTSSKKNYGPEHGYYTNEIPAKLPLIFPPYDHAPILKGIGFKSLYTYRTDVDGQSGYVWKPDDKPLTDEEKKKTTDQIVLVKQSFLDHGKLVFKKEIESPEIVIVTLIDFEVSEKETLQKIIQNRVDYAQKHNYGIYVRWIQEFIPMLQTQSLQGSYEAVKPLVMRAAMHAFPYAKQIFFLDHESLIMNLDLPLQQHLLEPKILELALLKNAPVTTGSNIKTYTHFKVENAKIIIPQSPNGYLDMSSFVVSTDIYGKAFLEFLMDPLFRKYEWESFSKAVAHILQWHPQMLGKTALVHQKLIAAPLNPNGGNSEGDKPGEELDPYHYTEGDLVLSLKGCRLKGTCAAEISSFYEKVRIH